jgi:hypothetical protein
MHEDQTYLNNNSFDYSFLSLNFDILLERKGAHILIYE